LQNSSSWVLYNMASFYWRIKNEPYQVVECAMRALHFSSRQNKDIALVNLANILHRAHFSADAAIVVHAALDYSDFFTSYYTLGNIYAMLGEYNHSVLCYDHALQAKPGFEQAVKRKHAVLCQQKLEQKLEAQHRLLKALYNLAWNTSREEASTASLDNLFQCLTTLTAKNFFLISTLDLFFSSFNPFPLILSQQVQQPWICLFLFGEDSSTSSMTSLNLDLHGNQSDHSQSSQSSPVARSIVSVWSVEANRDKQHILWPRRSECMKSYPKIPDPEELPTYFLPPENRGFRQVSPGDPVGHGETQAPDCSSITDTRNNESLNMLVKELDSNLGLEFKMPDDQARQVLHARVNNQTLTQEQIGALLDHAMKKPEDALWLVLNEAGLYWRAVGNGSFAITCLQKALNLAPQEDQDIPLVNLANLLIHYGLHLDAS
ncbi:TTC17 protein, partial [Indicator maculatus]|nr:TTC17 protein [Indicator maculatus]